MDTCQAKTASGTECRMKAGSSGYCHIHDPSEIAKREAKRKADQEAWAESYAKGERLREVLGIIEDICKAKGWVFYESSLDEDNWRYATISVERSVPTAGIRETITGVFDISVNGGVRVQRSKTSFYGHGLDDLYEAIMAQLRNLPWLESRKAAPVTNPGVAGIERLETILRRFHAVARQFRERHDGRETFIVNDEFDVQDLLHALLRSAFDDIRPEEPAPSRGGKSSRVDFLLKAEKIVIEIKLATVRLRDKEIADQLILDIERYQAHPDCNTLVCFIYDPEGQIRNAGGLENDLSGVRNSMTVRVLVVPR